MIFFQTERGQPCGELQEGRAELGPDERQDQLMWIRVESVTLEPPWGKLMGAQSGCFWRLFLLSLQG
jgi:hypothetical protein